MSDHLRAFIVGIVEGLTEFLPVSSTAHIRISQELLSIPKDDPYWKMFAIVIQLGAILSVLVYFRYRILGFLKTLPSPMAGASWLKHPIFLILVSFVVTSVPCFLLDKKIGDNLENLKVIGASLVIGGIVMWIVDKYFSSRSKTHRIEDMTIGQALTIGFTQIFAAAFPGVSRSMATIAGGQMMGLSRPAALEFSFFLSLPVMMAATLFKLLQFVLSQPAAMGADKWLVLLNGFLVSFLVAWFVIAWFMAWVNKHGFVPFAIYRLAAGTAVLWFLA